MKFKINMEGKAMKRFGLFILASVLGSALTIGTYNLFGTKNEKSFKIEHISSTPVVGAAYTLNKEGEIVPLEFTGVAKNVMPAVVHIKSTQLQKAGPYQYREYSNPFEDLFGDDMFKYFFGPGNGSPQPQQRGPQARVGTGSPRSRFSPAR